MQFGPVEVLTDIGLELRSGEVHAVIGENGAGKSTLMKLLSGYLAPTRGAIHLNGATVAFRGPVDAEQRGIVLVHQEILLAPDLTVAQNIFMGRELRHGLVLDDRAMNRLAAGAVERLGAAIDPRQTVARLSIAQRQLVQIARALAGRPRVIVLDEPTASLTPHETEALLNIIGELKRDGVAVLYISHRLPEVAAIADVVTVLRDGKHVATLPGGTLTPLDMAHLMVGRDMARLFPPRATPPEATPLLCVKDLSVPGASSDIAFTLRPGEILGFAGLIGAGRTETFEGLLGLRPAQGRVTLAGRATWFRSVRDSLAAGLVYLSEDRKGKGLLLAKPLAVNLTLAALHRFCRGILVSRTREAKGLEDAIARFDIRARRRTMLAGQLSGGNQQKLLLAKMMLREPRVVVIDEPTRGIDIGTKEQIYRLLAELAAAGKAVVVISSEMGELIGLCHRILVMRAGRIVGELAGEAMTERNIAVLATGADVHTSAVAVGA
ncbi:sugar ABC transporter ATP-binding protein [Lichenihabitans sp. Uapishka_5]|uniref:sugar ABC transporter ATP-binding protein n=1 Tax=Lichenihabitans sp. Uapishka_5 TaxID=3037302 RepID=UPI0029E7ECFB|nr:sugar ABC transporter ATP-binding protein [Lichenihabitans sp. Uapishka_5]MDX7951568.1 sugar ABC transporter ATP-binding protein [Lichenihabitans sp. Uapishka_5]